MHCFYNKWKCLQLHHGDGVQSEVALPDLLMASPSACEQHHGGRQWSTVRTLESIIQM